MSAWPWTLALAGVGLVLLAANRRGDLLALAPATDDVQPMPDAPTDDAGDPQLEQGQGGALVTAAAILSSLDPGALVPTIADDQADRNVDAFLHMIRYAEGTSSSDGYRTMFGGRLFDDFADHPRQPLQFTDQKGRRLWSSAAGAYQFMAVSPIPGGGQTSVDTWDRLQRKLGLPDFSPASQDAAALELIREAGALGDVRAGHLVDAIGKVAHIWASLPGAGYDQPQRTLWSLSNAFQQAGGVPA